MNYRNKTPEVLILSMREVANLVAFCGLYEFEDVVSGLLDADMMKFGNYYGLYLYGKVYKLFKKLAKSPSTARYLTSRVMRHSFRNPIQKDYDLIIANFNHPYELFSLLSLGNWRDRCQKSVCYITEFVLDDIPKCRHLLDLLKDFDHIFLATQQCVKAVSKITGRPCTYLPPSVDTIRFYPSSLNAQRPIHVCNLGRRSPITHQALLDVADERRLFYYYDTVTVTNVAKADKQISFRVLNAQEHRLLLANLLTRSSYFIANRGRANENLGNGQEEIALRFFEGAAAGAVILGDPPKTEVFKQCFNWQDAVIPLPFDAPNIGDVIADLDEQTERLQKIRSNNVANSLRRHDHLFRLQEIFTQLGIEPTQKMLNRSAYLQNLALEKDRKFSPISNLAT
jgi:hypothetical protein